MERPHFFLSVDKLVTLSMRIIRTTRLTGCLFPFGCHSFSVSDSSSYSPRSYFYFIMSLLPINRFKSFVNEVYKKGEKERRKRVKEETIPILLIKGQSMK